MAQWRKFFNVSFDDGLEQDKIILKIMRKYGIKGTFYLNSGLLGLKFDIKYIDKYGITNVTKGQRKRGFWKFTDLFQKTHSTLSLLAGTLRITLKIWWINLLLHPLQMVICSFTYGDMDMNLTFLH